MQNSIKHVSQRSLSSSFLSCSRDVPHSLRNLLVNATSLSGKAPDAPDKDLRAFIYRSMFYFLAVSLIIFHFCTHKSLLSCKLWCSAKLSVSLLKHSKCARLFGIMESKRCEIHNWFVAPRARMNYFVLGAVYFFRIFSRIEYVL